MKNWGQLNQISWGSYLMTLISLVIMPMASEALTSVTSLQLRLYMTHFPIWTKMHVAGLSNKRMNIWQLRNKIHQNKYTVGAFNKVLKIELWFNALSLCIFLTFDFWRWCSVYAIDFRWFADQSFTTMFPCSSSSFTLKIQFIVTGSCHRKTH